MTDYDSLYTSICDRLRCMLFDIEALCENDVSNLYQHLARDAKQSLQIAENTLGDM
jgi:hypothetical protein